MKYLIAGMLKDVSMEIIKKKLKVRFLHDFVLVVLKCQVGYKLRYIIS